MAVLEEPKLQQREFSQFRSMIFEFAGISLADSKQIMVQGRLAKRLRALGLSSYSEYLDYLLSNQEPSEKTKFINALTTNKTEFFREMHHFEYLTKSILPEVVKLSEASGEKKLRIWCSASSTGEEPYSIAMTVHEFFALRGGWDIRILASDIDTDVLATASQGLYDASRMEDVPIPLRKKYFARTSRGEDASWQAGPAIRDMITFRQINLLAPSWPINTYFDVIFCRNVMIYFDAPTQSKLVNQFAEKLKPEGHLIIGHSESLLGLTEQYKSLGDTVYRYLPSAARRTVAKVEATAVSAKTKNCTGETTLSQRPSLTPTAVGSPPQSRSGKVPSSRPRPTTERPDANEVSRIIVGELKASDQPIWISTLLGSCVAVCLFDDRAKIGGMNHFMLPECKTGNTNYANFGVHAMELLINAIMGLGGDRRKLQAKVFGGSIVCKLSNSSLHIGKKNIDFAMEFLAQESIPVVASHVGGYFGMRIDFHTHTHKVLLKSLDPESTAKLDQRDRERANAIATQAAQHADITLF